MLALLPFLCLVLLILVIQKKLSPGWRVSFMLGSVFWGFIITILTEVFSIFNIIGFWSVFLVWMILLISLSTMLLLSNQPLDINRIKLEIKTLSLTESLLITSVILAILIIGIAAWVYPPNTWDSMTYHMSRVMHWIQNHNIGFFPTSNLREVHQNPWTEYAILHLQLLSNGDRYANFVQLFCLIGCIIGVTLIAQELKVSRLGQILAAVFCVTIPMAILQGSSTQTDLVIAFWLTCFVFFSLKMKRRPVSIYAIASGMALGLSILTKATAYIFAFPFLLWFVISLIKNRVSQKWLYFSIIAILTLAINFGQYARNYDLYRNPLGSGQEVGGYKYQNDIFSLSSLTSNIIRNISLHLTITQHEHINMALQKSIENIHEVIKLSPNDERTTWPGTSFKIKKITRYEDSAGNLWHLIIIVLFLALLPFLKNKNRESIIYFLLLILAFVLFCGFLKWQPWHSRLHLPLFILFSPIVGLVQVRILKKNMVILLMLFFVGLSFPYLLQNKSRPLIDANIIDVMKNRNDEYFHNRLSLLNSYHSAAQALEALNCSNIGLIIGADDYEYPLWRLIEIEVGRPVYIEHLNVTNESRKFSHQSENADICAILTINENPILNISVHDGIYYRYWLNNPVNIYIPSTR